MWDGEQREGSTVIFVLSTDNVSLVSVQSRPFLHFSSQSPTLHFNCLGDRGRGMHSPSWSTRSHAENLTRIAGALDRFLRAFFLSFSSCLRSLSSDQVLRRYSSSCTPRSLSSHQLTRSRKRPPLHYITRKTHKHTFLRSSSFCLRFSSCLRSISSF